MGGINGTYVTTVDGVDIYADGIKHSTTTFSARIGHIDFSSTYDQVTDEGAWEWGASTQNPVVNIDSQGNVRIGGQYGVIDAGVIRVSDGTTGVYGGGLVWVRVQSGEVLAEGPEVDFSRGKTSGQMLTL